MTREEFAGTWDRMDEHVKAKWENLTRTERNELAGRRQKRNVELHELYGISEEEAERAIAGFEQTVPKMKPVHPAGV